MTLRTITYDTATHKLVPREADEKMLNSAWVYLTDMTIDPVTDAELYKAMIEVAPEYQEPEIDLESQDFYEVMQAYRHDNGTGSDTFEVVKQWLRNPVYEYQDTKKDE